MANALTVFRLIMVPVLFGLIMWANPSADKAAPVVFGLAAITDFLDGYIARRYCLITEFGKTIDPIADRALIAAAIVGLFFRSIISPLALTLLLTRDGAIAIGYMLAKKMDKPLVKVNQFGRIVNFYLMTAIFLLLFQLTAKSWTAIEWVFYLGVILYMASGLVYIVQEVMLLKRTVKENS